MGLGDRSASRLRHQYVWPRNHIYRSEFKCPIRWPANTQSNVRFASACVHVYRFNPISADLRHRKTQRNEIEWKKQWKRRSKCAHVLWASPTQYVQVHHNEASILFMPRLDSIHSISSINCFIVASGMRGFGKKTNRTSLNDVVREKPVDADINQTKKLSRIGITCRE